MDLDDISLDTYDYISRNVFKFTEPNVKECTDYNGTDLDDKDVKIDCLAIHTVNAIYNSIDKTINEYNTILNKNYDIIFSNYKFSAEFMLFRDYYSSVLSISRYKILLLFYA